MSMVKMTVRQCKDLGLWDDYCNWSGCNPYAVNEGQINSDDEIEFDSEFNKQDDKDIESEIMYNQEYCRKNEVYCIIQKVEFEYEYEQYTKYLVSHKNLDENKVSFELEDIEQLKYILSLEKY